MEKTANYGYYMHEKKQHVPIYGILQGYNLPTMQRWYNELVKYCYYDGYAISLKGSDLFSIGWTGSVYCSYRHCSGSCSNKNIRAPFVDYSVSRYCYYAYWLWNLYDILSTGKNWKSSVETGSA